MRSSLLRARLVCTKLRSRINERGPFSSAGLGLSSGRKACFQGGVAHNAWNQNKE